MSVPFGFWVVGLQLHVLISKRKPGELTTISQVSKSLASLPSSLYISVLLYLFYIQCPGFLVVFNMKNKKIMSVPSCQKQKSI